MNAQPESGYHYHVMRRAIDLIDGHDAALTLEELAREMGMSAAHFQRLFSQWVGVSPKRYQQYLTLGHAKALLAERFTTLEAADAACLSGTGRLHDLFLRWEAMSPGDFARGGDGLTIHFGWFDSPFGEALAMGTDRGLCGLAFSEEFGREIAMADMRSRWPKAAYTEAPDKIAGWVDAAFGGRGEAAVHMIGAPFQIKVWEALLQIPSGHVTTYSEIASAIGNPRAVRVGAIRSATLSPVTGPCANQARLAAITGACPSSALFLPGRAPAPTDRRKVAGNARFFPVNDPWDTGCYCISSAQTRSIGPVEPKRRIP